MAELTPAEKHAAYVREHGRLSGQHVNLVTRIIGDSDAPIGLRQMLWETTRAAYQAMGRPWTDAEPTEAKQ